jgi:hypothetical protein
MGWDAPIVLHLSCLAVGRPPHLRVITQYSVRHDPYELVGLRHRQTSARGVRLHAQLDLGHRVLVYDRRDPEALSRAPAAHLGRCETRERGLKAHGWFK